jgi:hypothetical protein
VETRRDDIIAGTNRPISESLISARGLVADREAELQVKYTDNFFIYKHITIVNRVYIFRLLFLEQGGLRQVLCGLPGGIDR